MCLLNRFNFDMYGIYKFDLNRYQYDRGCSGTYKNL